MQTANQVCFVGELDAFCSLVVEVIGQAKGIALIGFEHASGPFLDWHGVDRQIQLLKILHQGPMVMTGLL